MELYEHVRAKAAAAESDPSVITRDDAIFALRSLGLADFGVLMLSMPNEIFPKLSRLLPAMASNDVQQNWTGNFGEALLRQSCSFVRATAAHYVNLTGKSLVSASILDYGCGYGRIARLMYYFVDTNQLYGVDPWDVSIGECEKANLGPLFRQSEYLPKSLPFSGRKFDLTYAFSVFTHTSEEASIAALAAIRLSANIDSILCVTIRPIEYWENSSYVSNDELSKKMIRLHRNNEVAFTPHGLKTVGEKQTYGDTSMSLMALQKLASGWKIETIDRSLEDPLQILVYLRAI